MIALSVEQCNEYVLPLVNMTMGKELGLQSDYDFVSSDSWGLFDKDILIAVCGLGGCIAEDRVWLGYFAVHQDYRRQGLGTRALTFIENIAKDRGYNYIFVETFEHPTFESAIRLYKKYGYKEIGYMADYLSDDSDVIYLRKYIGDQNDKQRTG